MQFVCYGKIATLLILVFLTSLSIGVQGLSAPEVQRPVNRPLTSPAGVASLSTYSLEVLSNFDGINARNSNCGPAFDPTATCNPPDMGLAVGPNQVVQMVNLEMNIFWKSGILLQSKNMSQFWFGPGASQVPLSDPEVIYDVSSQRFFATIVQVPVDDLVAVSLSNNATGAWQIYRVPYPAPVAGSSVFPDRPLLGVSDDKVIISANDFSTAGPYVGAQYWIFNKNEMLAGASRVDNATLGPFRNQESVYPVQSLSSSTAEYMVSTGAFETGTTGSVVQLYTVTGVPPGNVNVTSLNLNLMSSIVSPPAAPQAGTPTTVWCSACNNGNDARILNAKWYQGRLWYALNEGCSPPADSLRTCVRLTQIDTSVPAVKQDFDYATAGQYFFFPALSIDVSGSIAVIYGQSSSSTFPSLAVTGQGFNDPASTIRSPQPLVAGSSDSLSGRFGDYFAAATDPSDPTVVWVAGEYYGGVTGNCLPNDTMGPCWSTRIASTRVEDFSLSANPSTVTIFGGGHVSSTITVASINGFAGTVVLSANLPGPGWSATFSVTTIALSSGGSSTSIIRITTPDDPNCQGTSQGPVFVIGTSGTLTQAIVVQVKESRIC
jgi:hypothetical protein